MKKILIIGNNDVGLYNFRKELIQRLVSDHYKIVFTVPYGTKVEEIKELGAEYFPIEINRRGTSIKEDYITFGKYKSLMTEVKPDLILTYTIKPNIYGGVAAKQLHLPCIATITGLGASFQIGGWKTRYIKALYKYGISMNKAVFFQNESNKEFFIKQGLIKRDKAVLVPGSGVNTDHFVPRSSAHDTVNFLFIARIMRAKGIEEFLEAAKRIKSRYTNTKFQLLGEFEEDCYKQQIKELELRDIVEYLGVSSDTRNEMAQADCIVLPSAYYEGMSNVLLEGASMGLPLITTDMHGCRETVEDGKSGFLCEVKDSDSLISAMDRFIALSPEERRRLGQYGRKKMINEFDRRFVVERYIKAIREALGEPS